MRTSSVTKELAVQQDPCGIPNRANYHIHVVYVYQGQTDYTDMYVCEEHMPAIQQRWCAAFEKEPTGEIALLRGLLKWDGSARADIIEWTTTELR